MIPLRPLKFEAGLLSTAVTGSGKLELIVGGSGTLQGPAILGTEENRLAFLMDFGRADYQREHYIYGDGNIDVAFMVPGQRSPQANFLLTHKYVIDEGLFGGTLSSRWPLLQADMREAKIKYRGLKKVDGVKMHEMEYRRRKGRQDSKIKIQFDEGDISTQAHRIRLQDLCRNGCDAGLVRWTAGD